VRVKTLRLAIVTEAKPTTVVVLANGEKKPAAFAIGDGVANLSFQELLVLQEREELQVVIS